MYFHYVLYFELLHYSSVSKVVSYVLEDRVSLPVSGRYYYPLHHCVQTGSGEHPASEPFPRGTKPDRVADSCPPRVEV